MSNFFKRCRWLLAFLIIAIALLSSISRALTPWAVQYKGEIEQRLSTLFGEPVHIQTMETGWYWFEPVIKLQDIEVGQQKSQALHLKKLLVGIDLFSSLWHWEIKPGVLYVDDMYLRIKQGEHGWEIKGLGQKLADQTGAKESQTWQPILGWILTQHKIILKNLSCDIQLKNGRIIPIQAFNLSIGRNGQDYRIKANASVIDHAASVASKSKLENLNGHRSAFQLLANATFDPEHWQKSSGHAYLSVEKARLEQWQDLLPIARLRYFSGTGNLSLWFDWKGKQITQAQAKIAGDEVHWLDSKSGQRYEVQTLQGNLAWQMKKQDWQLSADQLRLTINGTQWPENNFLLKWQGDQQRYQGYVQHLLIASFLSQTSELSEGLQRLARTNPSGELNDIQFSIKNNQPEDFIAQFSNLGWMADKGRPGVANVSGVIHWKPNSGKLELDSHDLALSVPNKPALLWQLVNAGFIWEYNPKGLQVAIDHLGLQGAGLKLNGSGQVADILQSPSKAWTAGSLSFDAQFAAEQAQKWMPFIPTGSIKLKLEDWLKNDVKRIGVAEGQLHLKGRYADFPFDHSPGDFKIESQLKGVDLIFAPNWPVTRDIDGYLTVNKRDLNVDLTKASLGNIQINQGNIRVDDIGHDRETLLIHAKVTTDAENALKYVLNTPLKTRLNKLSAVQIHGPLDLDFKLEAPLYPENDTILVLGDVAFRDNSIQTKNSTMKLELTRLNGGLQFDQEGILDGRLQAYLLDNPIDIQMQSVRKGKPYVDVLVKGQAPISLLQNKLNFPTLALLSGNLSLTSHMILTDDPKDLDHIEIKSNLKEVGVALPAPFGKGENEEAPLNINVDLNTEKTLHLQWNYDGRLGGNLWYASSDNGFKFEKGVVLLGEVSTPDLPSQGLEVMGNLPEVDVNTWSEIFSKLPASKDNPLLDSLASFDIHVKKIVFADQTFRNITVKAKRLHANNWALSLHQKAIDADLLYEKASNRLSGTIHYLELPELNQTASSKQHKVHPDNLPNLALVIERIRYANLELGRGEIVASTQEKNWQIDRFTLQSPSYLLTAKGAWRDDGTQQATTLQGNIKINQLANALAQWEISPAVEAKYGEIQFSGGWPGAVDQFKLSTVHGQANIELRNGRITHFSRETEEKLGLGKLLSILSLQTIPRRLTLDFSDLAQDGYSYDLFHGNFKINKGLMSTADSYIDGPIAYASMKGSINIVKQLYDLEIEVSPHITASLPVVATIVGGPIAGVATWLASKIINQGMQKISGYTYQITGPWKEPVVKQMSIIP